MADTIRVGAGCLNQLPLDWSGNRRRILESIAQAREAHVSVLCLPELAITGYGCEDQFLSHEVAERSWESLAEIAQHTSPKRTLLEMVFTTNPAGFTRGQRE